MSEVATHGRHNAAALFIQSYGSYPFPLPLLVSLKHGLTVGHTCLMKEMGWVRRIGACGGNNGVWCKWPAEPAMAYRPTCIQTNLILNALVWARSCKLKSCMQTWIVSNMQSLIFPLLCTKFVSGFRGHHGLVWPLNPVCPLHEAIIHSLIPRPFSPPDLDCLQYGKGLGDVVMCGDTCQTDWG